MANGCLWDIGRNIAFTNFQKERWASMDISVYITSYNQKEFLREALDSVLAQTLLPFEIVVVDDASTDGSMELIQEYHRQYPHLVKPHFNNRNLGITRCRNIALDLVKGDYVTALDGDDSYLPRKLEVQAQLIRQTGAQLVFTNFFYAENHLDNIVGEWCGKDEILPNPSNLYMDVLARNFPKDTLFRNELVKTDLMRSVGRYDESLIIYEDFDCRIRLAKNAQIAYSKEFLSIYRLHGQGLSRAPKQLHWETLHQIYTKYEAELRGFSTKDQRFIQERQHQVLALFKTPSGPKNVSLFQKVRRKLKKILKR